MVNYTYDVAFLDYDVVLCEMICDALTQNGLRVANFRDWNMALEHLHTNAPQFLIFNEICYNIDIVEFITRAKKSLPNTKLIVTFESEPENSKAEMYFSYKVDSIITKPFSIFNILEVMNRGGLIMNNYPQNGYGMPPQTNNPNGMQQPNNFNNMQTPQMNGMPQGYDANGMQSSPMGGMPQNFDMNGMPQAPMGGMPQTQPNPMGNMPQQGFDMNNMQQPMNGMNPMGNMPQQGYDMNGMQPNPMGGGMPQGYGMPPQGFGMPQAPMGGMQGYDMPQTPMGGGMPQGYGMPQAPMGGMQGYGMPQAPMGGMQGYDMPQQPPMSGMPQQGGVNSIRQTVFAVNCPKGGVGKTTISKELAIAYATTRVNGHPLKVCLVDGNLGFGDVTTMLKVPSTPNIKTWTTDIQQRLREKPDTTPRYSQQQIEENYLIKHQTGLFILAAPASHTDSLDIDAEQMGVVIDNLKECNFDIIIIDTANNTSDYTLIALEKAQEILMVSTMEVTSINDTRGLITTLREIQFPVEKIKLVINKMPQKSDKDIDLNEISAVLQIPILGVIPDFPKVRLINNNGEPAMMGKDNELTLAIKDLANKIVPVFNSPQGKGAKGGKASGGGEKKSLFGGLFGKK